MVINLNKAITDKLLNLSSGKLRKLFGDILIQASTRLIGYQVINFKVGYRLTPLISVF